MMFQTVSTNAAAILVNMGLWSTLVWAATYMYMNRRREQQVSALEHHIYEQDRLIDELLWEDGVRNGYAEYEVREDGTWHRVQ